MNNLIKVEPQETHERITEVEHALEDGSITREEYEQRIKEIFGGQNG